MQRPKPDEKYYSTSIWGPTCDGLDRIVERCDLPEMHVGDWMVFENMGAYTVAAASTFNGFQRPTIYYVMSGPTWLVTTARVSGLTRTAFSWGFCWLLPG